MSEARSTDPPKLTASAAVPAAVDRYLVFDEIGVGGMASVHIGMLTGAVGFRRIVALKQLHSRFIHDPDFVAQFINEARLAARIHHANVVQTLDVVWTGTQLMLVLEYVDGDTLNRVLRSAFERRQQVPIEVACSMATGLLHGLHAAHEVRDEEGVPLDIIHRDVSPQNILIGRDGVARVLDFGVAKALAQSPNTQSGLLKGKFGYMAPEQLMRGQVDRRADVFAAGVVLWETLTCRRLFQASKNLEQAMSRVVSADIPPPSTYRPTIPRELDAIVMKAMDREPDRRFQTAEELAVALEEGVAVASSHLVKTWFGPITSPELTQRAELIRVINKRYGTPGRSTPHPNALAEEARAALAAVEAEGGARRSWRADGLIPPPHQSGKYPIDSIPPPKPATRTLPPRRVSPVLAAVGLSGGDSTGGHISDIEEVEATYEPGWLGWFSANNALSGRNLAGALLILIGLISTWVTAIGWSDEPPTSERLRERREAARARAEVDDARAPWNAPGSERTAAPRPLPSSRDRAGSGNAAGRASDDPPRPRAKSEDAPNSAASAPGLELRPNR
ncbi:MAG TPA: serine/threonine-protein kinase [Polyangiaceae bacterium]|nr:serine/threonine-protein kinase [Polyangiaceae bacterium]